MFRLVGDMGRNQAGRERFAALWRDVPHFRRLMRRMTLIWGVAPCIEAALRLLLIELLPIAVFLPVSEAMAIIFIGGMNVWSWRCGSREMAQLRDTPAA